MTHNIIIQSAQEVRWLYLLINIFTQGSIPLKSVGYLFFDERSLSFIAPHVRGNFQCYSCSIFQSSTNHVYSHNNYNNSNMYTIYKKEE